MNVIKKSKKNNPKLSFIFLDWSVRESFHILKYLSQQDCDRDDYEVVIIEYYDRESDAIKQFESQVDTWVLLDMPHDYYYHKHLMYNVGIYFSKGEYISICDSDAMVKPDHVTNIISHFNTHPDTVLHIDQFRNNRQDLYPFNYPDFETVTGEGCINFIDKKTTGICDIYDPVHSRNYGACLCAKRSDVINIGGADEHIDFVGHICGPYDLTFRLINAGKEEIWSDHEFTYHTWHPGQAGVDNYLGPHDGKHMSTTSLLTLVSKRIFPLVENRTIKSMRENNQLNDSEALAALIDQDLAPMWDRRNLDGKSDINYRTDRKVLLDTYYGARIYKENNRYSYDWIFDLKSKNPGRGNCFNSDYASVEELKKEVYSNITFVNKSLVNLFTLSLTLLHYVRMVVITVKRPSRLLKGSKLHVKLKKSSQQQSNTESKAIDLLIYILRNKNTGNSQPRFIIKYDELVILSLKIFQLFKIIPKISIETVDDCNQVKEILEDDSQLICVQASTYIQFYTKFILYPKGNITIV